MGREVGVVTRFLLVLALCSLAVAQEPWDQPVQVPREVTYVKADRSVVQKAVTDVRTVLAPGYQGSDSLFEKLVIIGPFLWEKLQSDPVYSRGDGAAVAIKPYGAKGRLVREPAGMKALTDYLRRELVGGFRVRKLTPAELSLYWAITPDDIEEPILVLETPRHKFMLHWASGSVFLVDDYQNASFDWLEATSPPQPMKMEAPGGWSTFPARPTGGVLQQIILLTDDASFKKAATVDELSAYIKRLEQALSGAPGQQLVVQVELRPLRRPAIQAAARPALDAKTLRALELRLRDVPAPRVKGPCVFQLQARPSKK